MQLNIGDKKIVIILSKRDFEFHAKLQKTRSTDQSPCKRRFLAKPNRGLRCRDFVSKMASVSVNSRDLRSGQ